MYHSSRESIKGVVPDALLLKKGLGTRCEGPCKRSSQCAAGLECFDAAWGRDIGGHCCLFISFSKSLLLILK